MNSDSTKTDTLLDFLEIIHKTCIDKAPTDLTCIVQNMQTAYMFVLYSIVVELAGDSYQAVKSRKELASHVLIRTLLEAVVVLRNVKKNPDYINIHLKKALVKGEKPLKYLLDNHDLINKAGHTVKDIRELIGKSAKLCGPKVAQPFVIDDFKSAGMERYYHTMYPILCNYCHHSASTIINRLIGIKVRPLDEKGTQKLANWIVDLILKASIDFHESLKSSQINTFKNLQQKGHAILCGPPHE